MKVQFTISFLPYAQMVILRATTTEQNPACWIQWERILREALYTMDLQKTAFPSNAWGVILLIVSAGLLTACLFVW